MSEYPAAACWFTLWRRTRFSDADIGRQLDRQRCRTLHLLFEQGCGALCFRLRRLDDQLVVHLQDQSGLHPSSDSRRCTRTMASLMISAAVPWIGMLRATLSPKERVIPLEARSSGRGRRRP